MRADACGSEIASKHPMINRPRNAVRRYLWGALALLPFSTVLGDITGDFTLTSNQTFTVPAGDVFEFNKKGDTLDLQSFTAIFEGGGTFEINTSIIGPGSVLVDMSPPGGTVLYQSSSGNGYTGLTTVRGGRLVLDTDGPANEGILGDIYIGGGPNPAVLTRADKHNRELIADTSTITVASNGTLEFNRMDQGNAPVHNSLETFSKLILDGGTLLNSSDNTRLTTVNILDSVQLLSTSVIDLGVAMTMNIGDVDTTMWNSEAILTIRNWSPVEPVYVGEITGQQLGQIRFELESGIFGAIQLGDGQVVPGAIIPETSTFIFIPLLIGAALWPEIRRRLKKATSGASTR